MQRGNLFMYPEGHTVRVLNDILTYLWCMGGDGGFREMEIQREKRIRV